MAKNKKEVATTEVALTSLTANDVPAMLKKVTEQIKMINGSLPSTPKTDGEIPGFGKISEIETLSKIIQAGSSVIGKKEMYDKVKKEIMPKVLKTPPFKIDGMGYDAMVDHLKVRAIEVGHKEQLAKLTKIKITLESNLSAEAKLANDLKAIQGMLDD